MKPLVTEAGRLNLPSHIPVVINVDHPGAALVTYLANTYPRACSRQIARREAHRAGWEPRHAAGFEWLILRINDTLPLLGWRLDDSGEHYRLKRIEGNAYG